MEFDPKKLTFKSHVLLESGIQPGPNWYINPTKPKKHEIKFKTTINFDSEKETVSVRFRFDINCLTETEEKIDLKGWYVFYFRFQIKDFAIYANSKNIDFGLLANLFGVSYSTARGLLIGLTNGTSLSTVYLPVVNSGEEIEKLYATRKVKPPIKKAKSS